MRDETRRRRGRSTSDFGEQGESARPDSDRQPLLPEQEHRARAHGGIYEYYRELGQKVGPVKLILFQKFSIFLPFIMGAPSSELLKY